MRGLCLITVTFYSCIFVIPREVLVSRLPCAFHFVFGLCLREFGRFPRYRSHYGYAAETQIERRLPHNIVTFLHGLRVACGFSSHILFLVISPGPTIRWHHSKPLIINIYFAIIKKRIGFQHCISHWCTLRSTMYISVVSVM